MSVPGTGRVLIDRIEAQNLIDEIRASVPEDVLHAEEVLKSREELVADAREEAQQIRRQAEELFQQRTDEHEITEAARARAQEILRQTDEEIETRLSRAEAELAARRRELDDYSLGVLRRLESSLTTQLEAVREGIENISGELAREPGDRYSVR